MKKPKTLTPNLFRFIVAVFAFVVLPHALFSQSQVFIIEDAITLKKNIKEIESSKESIQTLLPPIQKKIDSIAQLIINMEKEEKVSSKDEIDALREDERSPRLKSVDSTKKAFIELKAMIVGPSFSLYHILNRYQKTPSSNVNYSKNEIFKNYENNPFIYNILKRIETKLPETAIKPDNSKLAMKNSGVIKIFAFSSLSGGSDAQKPGISAMLLNDVADIMLERAKVELNIAFFNRFAAFQKSHPEFQALFPKTTDNLDHLVSIDYSNWLPILRSGFIDDLNQLANHLDDVVLLEKYAKYFQVHPELAIAIHCITIGHNLETSSYRYSDILNDLANLKEWSNINYLSTNFQNLHATIQLAHLIDYSLKSWAKTSIETIEPAKLSALFSFDDYDGINSYFGLLFQVTFNSDGTQRISFLLNGNSVPLSDLLKNQYEHLELWENKLTEFVNLAKKEKDALAMTKAEYSPDYNKTVYTFINASADVIDYSFDIVMVLDSTFVNHDCAKIARKANMVYKDIYSKNYGLAIGDGLDFIQSIADEIKNKKLTKGITDLQAKLAALTAAITVANPLDTLVIRKQIKSVVAKIGLDATGKQSMDELSKLMDAIRPYAILIANIAEATDEAGIKNALEDAILPAGSASIKKTSFSNLSLQSYLGGFVNFTPNSNIGTFGKHGWITAPVGFQYSRGHKWFNSKDINYSTGLFVGLLDLGAIIDYKLVEGSNQDLQVNFAQVFSPSIYFAWGLPMNFPLTLCIGGQAGGVLTGNINYRAGIMLAFDIPFFTLHNVRRKE